MDACRFLNSKDVAAHLQEIGYEFTAPEAAFVVYQSRNATLEEKMDTWLEIAETMPDCSMEKRIWMEPILSFRSFLHDYVDLSKRMLDFFFDANECAYDCFACLDDHYEDEFRLHGNTTSRLECDDLLFGNDRLFGDAESCLEYAKDRWKDHAEAKGFKLRRRWIGNSGNASVLFLNRNFEPVSVMSPICSHKELGVSFTFDGMSFAIPTPFYKGEIVRDASCKDSRPFVLSSLPSWGREECAEKGFAKSGRALEWANRIQQSLKNNGSLECMHAFGFIWNGSAIERRTIECCYLDLEYADHACEDEDMWAFPVNNYIWGACSLDEAADRLYSNGFESEASILDKKYLGESHGELYIDQVWKDVLHEKAPWE